MAERMTNLEATMSGEIGPLARDFTLIPKSLEEAKEIGDLIAKSGFAPKGYVGKPADVIIGIQMGLDVGLSPMQALQSIAVINGKPSIYGDAAIALVYRSGQLEHLDAPEPQGPLDDALTAVVKVVRRGHGPLVRTFSIADAKRAKLWGKEGPWSNYPRRMLMLRARAFAIRDAFADVLLGLGIVEEAQDIETTSTEVKVEAVPLPRAIEAPATPPAPLGPGTATTPPPVSPLPPAPPPAAESAPAPAPRVAAPTPPPAAQAPTAAAKPSAEQAAAAARLPKLTAPTDDNTYLGKASYHIKRVWKPMEGESFYGIETTEGLLGHTWDAAVAAELTALIDTDHLVMFTGVMVEHPKAPLQVHSIVVVTPTPPPAPAVQPPAAKIPF